METTTPNTPRIHPTHQSTLGGNDCTARAPGAHRARTTPTAHGRLSRLLLVGTLAACTSSSRAQAEPLVVMEGANAKPGIVTSWSSSGKKVTLTVRKDANATAVAKTITDETGAKAKVTGDKILVIGKTEEELLNAMSQVDFGGDPTLLAAASFKSDGFDSGSSLRAKKTADMAKLMKDQSHSLKGKVTDIQYGKFPETILAIRVLRGPTGELAKTIRKGATLKFRPALKKKGEITDFTDETTQQNASGWYLEKGDTVEIRVGKSSQDVFEAELITR
ncbi:MAG: hypothetical protein IPK13_25440 [Deltaproteobacteria bacterium]|nr:hypothetical protein [Deltaproteobacteria bacterium]